MRSGYHGPALRAVVCLAAAVALAPTAQANGTARPRVAPTAKIVEAYGNLPLYFEQNIGQEDGRVKFLSRGNGYSMFLLEGEAVLALRRPAAGGPRDALVRMQFAGASPAAAVSGVVRQPGVSNYFTGPRENWISGAKHFGKVLYSRLYPGIDAVFYGNQRQLEYDFVVAPGADPGRIRLRFDGVDSVELNRAGALVLKTAGAELVQNPPVIYQDGARGRETIRGKYVVRGREVAFEVARYDRRRPLVIDPTLIYSTFLGGAGGESGNDIVLDAARNAYIAGETTFGNFVFFGGNFSSYRGGTDAFVAKLSADGRTLLLLNFLGGTANDRATSIALDSLGSIWVGGDTSSSGASSGLRFPITPATANHPDYGGGNQDGFLSKFSPDGASLQYSTFIGGFGDDFVNDIAIGPDNGAYVVGRTTSNNLNAAGGAIPFYQSGPNGLPDGYIFKFSNVGARVYGSYIAGNFSDSAEAVAVDSLGSAYIAGRTQSSSFPLSPLAVQRNFGSTSASDAFVVKLNPAGSQIVYSTLHGGAGADIAYAIAVDAAGNAYVTGDTDSTNLPMAGAFQPASGGMTDAFVLKLNPTATARLYSSYIGGSLSDYGRDLALDVSGVVHVAGFTYSTNFPINNFVSGVLNGASGQPGADAFVVRVSADGATRISSTYLGGVSDDFGYGIAVDENGNDYVTGQTSSTNFPTVNPLQASFAGDRDAFISKVSNCEITLSSTGVRVGPAEGTTSVLISGASDCPWTVSTLNSWITITGPTSGAGNALATFSFTATAGPPRVGTVLIGGRTFTITQEGLVPPSGCVYPPNPQNVIAPASGQQSTFVIETTLTTCNWTATSNAPWLQVFPLSGSGPATLSYTVFPNFTTLVRVASITIGGTQFNVTQAGTNLNANQRFVAYVYFNFLGRYPSQTEIDFQVSQLAVTTRHDLVMNFYNAEEFNLGGRFIAGLYVGLLGRDPEFGGWLFQRNALVTGGITQAQLVANFLGSQEFQLKYGALSDADYVRLLYRNVLGREGSDAEVANQLAALPALGRIGMALNFLNSTEFRTRVDSRLTAFLLYATLLGRGPTPAELENRRVQIQSGVPVRQLVQEFIASAEFLDRLI